MENEEQIPSEQLSQNEIERLLSEIAKEKDTTVVYKCTGAKTRFASDQVRPYDFKQLSYLTPADLRILRVWHERFFRSLSARISTYLKMEVRLQLASINSLKFDNFMASVANPSFIFSFAMEPLPGTSYLEVPTRLGLAIIDRLMGGRGQAFEAELADSEINVALLEHVIKIWLSAWCSSWGQLVDMHPVLIGVETNSRFVESGQDEKTLIALGVEVQLGDCLETLQMGFCFLTLSPILKKFRQLATSRIAAKAEDTQVSQPAWNETLSEAPVRVKAVLPEVAMNLNQLNSLQPGEFLWLDAKLASQVEIKIEERTKFVGQLGSAEGKAAVFIQAGNHSGPKT